MHADGLPIAASGIASSMPVVTPAPEPAAHPAPTPPVLWLSIVASIPNGFDPPVSVPGAPALLPPPRNRGVAPPPVGSVPKLPQRAKLFESAPEA